MTVPWYAHPLDPPASHRLAAALARPVGLGYLTEPEAKAALVLHAMRALRAVPDRPDKPDILGIATRLAWTLHDATDAFSRQRDAGMSRIRREIWPLCQERRPGVEIIRAALRVAGPALSQDEVTLICRRVAASSLGGARRGR